MGKGAVLKVLLVEDDPSIVRALQSLLNDEGFDALSAASQDEALGLLEEDIFDIALLDISLAQGNGFAVCAAAREIAPTMPVIFLTASDDEFSTVAGLDMGAADYIAKPFRPRELLSRIRAALRKTDPAEETLRADDVVLDATSASVRKGDQQIFLSALEYKLLLFLFQRAGKLVTRENLKDAIWESAGEYVSDNALNVYIRRLREKIETDPADPRVIVTVRGLGYKVVP